MNKEKQYFWFSFSSRGGNIGVVLTESTSQTEALRKITDLGLVPERTVDTRCWEINTKEIELDVFISSREMRTKKGYVSTRQMCKEHREEALESGKLKLDT